MPPRNNKCSIGSNLAKYEGARCQLFGQPAMLGSAVYAAFFVVSALLTFVLVRTGHHLRLVDLPNERSSHNTPKPRGGGIAFTVSFYMGILALEFFGLLSRAWTMPLFIGGLPVALIGLFDDIRSRSAKLRLAIHFVAAVLAYGYLTDRFQTKVDISFLPGDGSGLLEIAFAILYMTWMINLYNFMDGIDGLAAGQAVLVAILSAALCVWQSNWQMFALYSTLAATVFGFLIFNWAPAKIFMGDCGAYFLGFSFACLALMNKIYSGQSLLAHMILFGVFIADATYTLIVRVLNGKPFYKAHRDHGFQHFVSRGRSHAQVAIILNGITLIWLAPLAVLSIIYSDWASIILIVSYIPLVALMFILKAGIDLSNSMPKDGVNGAGASP